MPELQHFGSDADQQEMLTTIHRDGAIIIDGVIGADTVASLRAETDPYMDASGDGQDAFSGFSTTRTGGLVARSAQVRDLIQHQLILELCDGFLLENCERYQLHLAQIIRLRPGQGTQQIHRDRWAWGTHLSHVEPQLNTIWAVTDFTLENGATRVVPGSCDWPDEQRHKPGEICQASMEQGSVLVYTGSVFHGGGENTSDDDRIGLNITYSLGWLRQEENQYLSTPPELASTLTPELQELIGYAMGQYALGYFTPPGAPGEGPETVPPQYALGRRDGGLTLGSQEDFEATMKKTSGAASP